VVYKKLNSTGTLIQRTTIEAPRLTYVLHRTGCSKEDHQLLRERCSGQIHRQGTIGATRNELIGG
jgi:hypothetical protein